MEWQLQQAKAKFSKLVQKVIDEGPQTVTVVVLSAEQFDLMKRRQISLKDTLAMVLLEGVGLEPNQGLAT